MARVPLIKFRYAAMKASESAAHHLNGLQAKMKFEPTRSWSTGKFSAATQTPSIARPVSTDGNKTLDISEITKRAPLSKLEIEAIMLGGRVE